MAKQETPPNISAIPNVSSLGEQHNIQLQTTHRTFEHFGFLLHTHSFFRTTPRS